MQVRLYFPFVDFRHKDKNLSDFALEEPYFPHNLQNDGIPFIRCHGRLIKSDRNEECVSLKNGLTTSSKSTINYKIGECELIFPYKNSILGVYNIVINLEHDKNIPKEIEDILIFLNNNIVFTMRFLCDSYGGLKVYGPKPITKKAFNLFDMSKMLKEQYYYNTLRLKDKRNMTLDIMDPNPLKSKEKIVFLRPIISIDSKIKWKKDGDLAYIPLAFQIYCSKILTRYNIYVYSIKRHFMVTKKGLSDINRTIHDNIIEDIKLFANDYVLDINKDLTVKI
jgi:hypothetical protein